MTKGFSLIASRLVAAAASALLCSIALAQAPEGHRPVRHLKPIPRLSRSKGLPSSKPLLLKPVSLSPSKSPS